MAEFTAWHDEKFKVLAPVFVPRKGVAEQVVDRAREVSALYYAIGLCKSSEASAKGTFVQRHGDGDALNPA